MLNWMKKYKDVLRPYAQWSIENPRKAGTLTLIVISPIVDYWLKKKAKRDLIDPVLKRMETGTKPPVPIARAENMVSRPKLESELHKLFCPSTCTEDTFFRIIIGPSGTGKTVAVTDLCRRFTLL